VKTAGKVVATRIFSFAPAKDSKLPKLNWGWARFKFIRLWGQLAPKLKLGKKSGGSQTRTSLAQRSFFGKWAVWIHAAKSPNLVGFLLKLGATSVCM
jgi:hypothetical protein